MGSFVTLRSIVIALTNLVVLVVLVNLSFWLDRVVGNRWLWSSRAAEFKLLLDEKGHYVMGSSGEPLLVDRDETEISRENRGYIMGNDRWFVNQTDPSIVDYTSRPILLEGFATKFSHFPDDRITFKIDTVVKKDLMATLRAQRERNETLVCKIDTDLQIYRMGYYYGAGARLMDVVRYTTTIDASQFYEHSQHFYTNDRVSASTAKYVHSQAECNLLETSVVDCDNWQDSVSWHIPPHDAQHPAVTGVYVAVPVIVKSQDCVVDLGSGGDAARKGLSIPFIVKHESMRPYFPSDSNKKDSGVDSSRQRTSPPPKVEGDDGRRRIIFRTADLTWAAYNKYGGWNLYQGPAFSSSSPDKGDRQPFTARARMVSYNRPYHNRLPFPLGQAQNFLFGSEYPLLLFLERLGYNVVYISCEDSEVLSRQGYFGEDSSSGSDKKMRPMLLSVGHDEYWTAEMVRALEGARDAGSPLAFFSGNEAFWRVSWASHEKVRGGARLVYCNKDTIDVRSPSGQGQGQRKRKEWTGTFVDPTQPDNDLSGRGLPHSLTGQYFYVNAYRSDPLHVPYSMSRLRLWRNVFLDDRQYQQGHGYSYTGWHSYSGVLGYEWDAPTTTLCSHQRPTGIFPLSLSRFNVKGQLMQQHGAAYKGSGVALHEITLYRHQPKLLHETDSAHWRKVLDSHPSSLVFAAGTPQWSWALSDWHDGDHITGRFPEQSSPRGGEGVDTSPDDDEPSRSRGVRRFPGNIPPVDPELQQATMNVLADMGCLPASATNLHHRARYTGPLTLAPPAPEEDRSAYAYVRWAFSNRTRLRTITTLTDFPYATPISADDEVPPASAVHHVSLSKDMQGLRHPRGTRHATNSGGDADGGAGAGALVVKGVASDAGGGRVAGVEVSLDYGQTWQRAALIGTGRAPTAAMGGVTHWTYSMSLHVAEEEGKAPAVEEEAPEQWGVCKSRLLLPREVLPHIAGDRCQEKEDGSSAHLVVLSRAVDDSGWLEPVPPYAEVVNMTRARGRRSCDREVETIQNNVKLLCLPKCNL